MTAEQKRKKVQKELAKHEVKSYLVYVGGLLFSYFIAELIGAINGLQTMPTWEVFMGIGSTALSISVLKLIANLLGLLNHSIVNPINMDDMNGDKQD